MGADELVWGHTGNWQLPSKHGAGWTDPYLNPRLQAGHDVNGGRGG